MLIIKNMRVYLLSLLVAYSTVLCAQHGRAVNLPESLSGLTPYTLPLIDGSDSTMPLRHILISKLLGLDYNWRRDMFAPPGQGLKMVYLDYSSIPNDKDYLIKNKLVTTNTHPSFISLIDGKADIIITARDISRDEQVYACEKDVRLLSMPIAKDALTFMVSPKNPVENLSQDQIRGIFSGYIKFWGQVGGSTYPITPYLRNKNSGSQEKFETMVMAGLEIPNFPELQIGTTMESPYIKLKYDETGISFTPFYYYDVIVDNDDTKAIGVDGIPMTREHIVDGSYPYITEVFVSVREDIDRTSPAYKLYEFMTTPEGQAIVEESGYVPVSKPAGIYDAEAAWGIMLEGKLLRIPCGMHVESVKIFDTTGKLLFSEGSPEGIVDLNILSSGIYMISVHLSTGETKCLKIRLQ